MPLPNGKELFLRGYSVFTEALPGCRDNHGEGLAVDSCPEIIY
jgi:hypothetical protein